MSREREEEPPVLNEDFSNVIVVDNLPKVGMEKFEKLVNVVRKKFQDFGEIIEDGLYLPVEEGPKQSERTTAGFAFIEFSTPEAATAAVANMDNAAFDKTITLRVSSFADYEKYINLEEKYVAPKQSDFNTRANLNSWLSDTFGRDQFVVRFRDETQIFWNDQLRAGGGEHGRVLVYDGMREKEKNKTWTEMVVSWSPKGTYFVTFHKQGVVTWGGEAFEKLHRFGHQGVKYVDWSPDEKYLVTSTGEDRQRKTDPECIIVWDARRGVKLRGFDKGISTSWPAFKWSFDGRYLARVAKDPKSEQKEKPDKELAQDNIISIYETPTLQLLEKKSIFIPGVTDIEWSPTQNILSFAVPESGNIPAKVALLEIPSRKLVREKHLYSVTDIHMHWQDQGDYLCVKMTRAKTKKHFTTNFEIFCMREQNVPIEQLEVNDQPIAFAWEPRSDRFAVIHGSNPAKPDVSFYGLKKKRLELIKTFAGRAANRIFWAPAGGNCVIAGLGSLNGILEFIEVTDTDATSLVSQEHFQCTDVEWDPSGRFVLSSVCRPLVSGPDSWKYGTDSGYKVWNMHGAPKQTVNVDALYQVMWRPRPPTLLTPEQVSNVKKQLNVKYYKRFLDEDSEALERQEGEVKKQRRKLREDWNAYRQKCEKEYNEEREEREQVRNGVQSDDEDAFEDQETALEEEIEHEEIPA